MKRELKIGETYRCLIDDLSGQGPGVARIESCVVFVPFTVPGDEVEIELTQINRRYAEGRLIEVIKKSDARIEPRCEKFMVCGGCQWQHVSYDLSWKTKVAAVYENLKRNSLELDVPIELFPAESVYHYRNRIQFQIEDGKVGFFTKNSHEHVPIERCWLVSEGINQFIQEPKNWPSERVEVAEQGDRIFMVEEPLFGQVNSEQNVKLRNWIETQVQPGSELLDLYSGSGNLSELLVKKFDSIVCVDQHTGNQPREKTQFIDQDVREYLRSYRPKNKDLTVICDPPRGGFGNPARMGLKSLFGKKWVKEWVYVSCSPSTWAKDLKDLMPEGFKIKSVAAFDFFPQTPHVEVAAYGVFC